MRFQVSDKNINDLVDHILPARCDDVQQIEKDTLKRLGLQGEPRLDKIDRDLLTPIVRKALGSLDASISEWDYKVIKGDWTTSTRLVCRIFGKAKQKEHQVPWSVFLKVPNPTHLHYDPLHREPFQREVLLYQSGILDNLPGGIVAPRCLGVTEHADDEPWMWLEDVRGTRGLEWPLERFEKIAHQFGCMQGAFLAGAPLPDHGWLDTSAWLKPRLALESKPMPEILDRSKTHPLTAPLWDSEFGQRFSRLWSDHEVIFEALDRMPRSLCHGDFCFTNFIARRLPSGEDQTVVLDWQYAGVRQIGSDIAGLIADSSLIAVRRKVAEPEEFTEMILEGYVSGLQESGWKGDLRVARFACLATLAWHWTSINALGLRNILQQPLSEENRHELKQRLDEYVRRQEFLFRIGDEAKQLLAVLSK